jgi:glycosyltransferase involved in cell wall biosynthesis
MRVGIVFHKNPFLEPTGIDLVRLRAIAGGLIKRGIQAEIISPVAEEGMIDGFIPVRGLRVLSDSARYHVIKTSYHYSIELIRDYTGPVVSRIVRVVDGELPERDAPFRKRLLECQETIRDRSSVLVLNNAENRDRWNALYGNKPRIELIPTGCPAKIPPSRANPYLAKEPGMLFLGSVAAPRMVHMINEAASLLEGQCAIHLVGLNKACLYGGDDNCVLSPLVVDHGELPEPEVWDYIRNATVGLALATGSHAFDNDVSKILNYLRGGLPVLSEEPIINNELVRQTGLGTTFAFDDVRDLAAKARELLRCDFRDKKQEVMRFMASEHSWDRRAEAYAELFSSFGR